MTYSISKVNYPRRNSPVLCKSISQIFSKFNLIINQTAITDPFFFFYTRPHHKNNSQFPRANHDTPLLQYYLDKGKKNHPIQLSEVCVRSLSFATDVISWPYITNFGYWICFLHVFFFFNSDDKTNDMQRIFCIIRFWWIYMADGNV